MINNIEPLRVDRPETDIAEAAHLHPELFIQVMGKEIKLNSSITYSAPLESSEDIAEGTQLPDEQIQRLDFALKSTTPGVSIDENWVVFLGIEVIIRSEIRQTILSEFRQFQKTHWVQNLQHPSYHLCQPIPILIEKSADAVKATYSDVELHGTGSSEKEAKSNLCAKIVARYKELEDSAPKSQDYMFLKRIIEEVEPAAWQELKHSYKEKLEEIPYVQEGYINISAPEYADVILVLSEYSVDRIEQLAEIDLELNLKFRPLHFFVQYESFEDRLEVRDFERFY